MPPVSLVSRHQQEDQKWQRSAEIQLDHQNITGRMRIAMLDKWFSKEENPSWEKIIAALEEMHETSLASRLNQVRSTYIKKIHFRMR